MHGRGTWEETRGGRKREECKQDNVKGGTCKEGKKGNDKGPGEEERGKLLVSHTSCLKQSLL